MKNPQALNNLDTTKLLLRDDLTYLLNLNRPEEIQQLYEEAYQVKLAEVGDKVYFRGIIEFSNVCSKDCFYCGIRRSNNAISRYQMSHEEILATASWACENGYGSIVIQSGERQEPGFIDVVEDVLMAIRNKTGGRLGITLSLGEQDRRTFQRWFKAGAHRYLLRIETTNSDLYQALHPGDHDFETRRECLSVLKETGYQVGTGVMSGLPGQTTTDLAEDIKFFKEQDIDMIGMGPYIPHAQTPLAEEVSDFNKDRQLTMALKMIAVTRLALRDVNIAATTALQALKDNGRELGLLAGANIVMPNITDTKYRSAYQLYNDKPCLDENAQLCRTCLAGRVAKIGEMIGFNEWGDSPHFFRRKKSNQTEGKPE